ncbi:hypothetical protein OpiT1DRAFT_04049 [Opitutaceae bacterium TAV1]|nr:hypothetical protein OpiT1DRAFT_04049 [Opitutaceae bacterium TAV1]
MTASPPDHPLTAGVCAAALKTCAWLGIVSLVLFVAATFIALLVHAGPVWLASIFTGCAAQYFHARLTFDRHLFTVLARADADPAIFDTALGHLLGARTRRPGRTLADRWRGTRRLVRAFLASLALQTVLLLVALAASLFFGR